MYYIHRHRHTCTHVTYTETHTHAYIHTHAHSNTYIIYTGTHTHKHTYTQPHKHLHRYTHTHKHVMSGIVSLNRNSATNAIPFSIFNGLTNQSNSDTQPNSECKASDIRASQEMIDRQTETERCSPSCVQAPRRLMMFLCLPIIFIISISDTRSDRSLSVASSGSHGSNVFTT